MSENENQNTGTGPEAVKIVEDPDPVMVAEPNPKPLVEMPRKDLDPTAKKPKRPIDIRYVALGLFGGLIVLLVLAIIWMQSAVQQQVQNVWQQMVAAKSAVESVNARLGAIEQSVIYTDPDGNKKSVADISADVRYLVDPMADDPIVRMTVLNTRMKATDALVQKRTSKKYLIAVMSKVPALAAGRTPLYVTFESEKPPVPLHATELK